MKLSYKKATVLFIFVSIIFRIVIAGNLEFGNDEVYYWLYAKYPDISHFDHPPMVGFFIQFFTANLFFDSELAIRLAAIIPSAISMYLVFLIASHINNEKSGFISVLLYSISIYGFVIAGTFILPDSPLVVFWLLSFYFFIQTIPYDPINISRLKIILAFLFSGLAIYSKYQAIFLLFGVLVYVVLFNRIWLKKRVFYLGFLFPLFFVFLIFYWNYQNDFISYRFHGERVSFFSLKFNSLSFFRELLGQALYNNPYVVVSFVCLLIAFFKNKFLFKKDIVFLFLCCSLPLILTTIYLSLYKNTLPHWSGISYLTLLPLIAVYLSQKKVVKGLVIAIVSFSFLMVVALLVINKGYLLSKPVEVEEKALGKKDVLLDMYGWKQVSIEISKVLEEKELKGLPIVSNKWYPASHIHYYIARPSNIDVYGVGELSDIHKYYWINKQKKHSLDSVLYITDSRNYKDPEVIYSNEYKKIDLLAVFPVKRGGYTVKNFFLYVLMR